ncbi:hypothetical protein IC620_13855 [Hazenella sp. IB182357]|uniref:Uncharacterized protein n=1 Tax=Polycladospora coralii TaxID=2771432 RepID=A0A926NCS1_9BACL|nr:hypothetical protein [Polycladospora coralii]MBD1373435.1 hypothetical protein [Polycladospora coralii]MBS7531213.1 hypothetical protein [Polycladospora coralii]
MKKNISKFISVFAVITLLLTSVPGFTQNEALAEEHDYADYSTAIIEPGMYKAFAEKSIKLTEGDVVTITYANPGTRSFRVYLGRGENTAEKPYYAYRSVTDKYVPRGSEHDLYNFTVPKTGTYKVFIQCVQSERNLYPRNDDCYGIINVKKYVNIEDFS